MQRANTMNMFLVILTISLCLLPLATLAGGTTTRQEIKKLYLAPNGSVRIYGTVAWTNKDKCQSTAFGVLKSDHAYYKNLYAMLLVAHADNIKVALTVKGCVKTAGKTRPVVTGVYMH